MNTSDSADFQKAQAYARFCGFAAIAVGFLVLFGWQFRIEWLKTLVPGLVTMNPMTAVTFELSGLAVLLLTSGQRAAPWVSVLGAVIAGIGLLKMGDLLGYWHCPVDTWIYGERVDAQIFHGRPNRIAPNTALNFVMQGYALMLCRLGMQRGAVSAQILLAVQGLTSLVAALGYFYGARSLNDFGIYSPMALPTALNFLILTVGTLCAMPDRGVMRLLVGQGEAGMVTQRLLMSGLASPLLLGYLTLWGQGAGYYPPMLSVAIFCVAATFCFMVLTLWHGATLLHLQAERQLQQAEIRESEERFKLLSDAAFEGIVITRNALVLDANRQFCLMFGYSLEEIRGMHAKMFNAPPQRDLVSRRIDHEVEHLYASIGLRKDGSEFPIEVFARTIPLNGEKARVAAIRDITERRAIEKMKDEFVSVVNHELRTPLTSIHGALGLMANGMVGPLTGSGQSMADVALRNAKRLLTLINDLLDIQKIEAGEMTFHLRPVELGALLDNSMQTMQSYGDTLSVRFDYTPLSRPIWLRSDPDRLSQVIANLLSNAAKFSPPQSIVCIVPREYDDKVRIEICDQGVGIPIEFQDRIFQKFAQADSSSTRHVNGTGLGLSICKAILDNLNGTIGFETELGRGSTFYFELPLDSDAFSAEVSAQTPQSEPEFSRSSS